MLLHLSYNQWRPTDMINFHNDIKTYDTHLIDHQYIVHTFKAIIVELSAQS